MRERLRNVNPTVDSGPPMSMRAPISIHSKSFRSRTTRQKHGEAAFSKNNKHGGPRANKAADWDGSSASVGGFGGLAKHGPDHVGTLSGKVLDLIAEEVQSITENQGRHSSLRNLAEVALAEQEQPPQIPSRPAPVQETRASVRMSRRTEPVQLRPGRGRTAAADQPLETGWSTCATQPSANTSNLTLRGTKQTSGPRPPMCATVEPPPGSQSASHAHALPQPAHQCTQQESDQHAGSAPGTPHSGAWPLRLQINPTPRKEAPEEVVRGNRTNYKLSASGTFCVGDFRIRRTGLAQTPGLGPGTPSLLEGPENDPPLISSAKSPAIVPRRGQTLEHGGLTGEAPGEDCPTSRFVDLGVLGKGSSSVVYKAVDLHSLRLVARKQLPMYDDQKRKQLVQELRALRSNQGPGACPHIVQFYDAFSSPQIGSVSMVVEYMDGGSLQDMIDLKGTLPEPVLGPVAHKVLLALDWLHTHQRMHRDIKPANLLIDHGGRVKLSDFGIARDMQECECAESFVGTFTFMSPERIGGDAYSYPADVWSFGLTILTCYLGRFPYSSSSGYWGLLNDIRDHPAPSAPATASKDFASFISACLHKDPSKRPSVSQLLAHKFVQSAAQSHEPTDNAAFTRPRQRRASRANPQADLELEEIICAVKAYYESLWREQARSGAALTVPSFTREQVAVLSRQMGIDEKAVRLRFAVLLRDLRLSNMRASGEFI